MLRAVVNAQRGSTASLGDRARVRFRPLKVAALR
jgi:hypothetical protein